MPKVFDIEIKDTNSKIVERIEQKAMNNIEHTLDGVIDFINHRHKDLEASYRVFKELFVVCWAGIKKNVKGNTYYSRVDIELINEQVRLFYSALDEVSISYTNDYFKIVEFVQLGINKNTKFYPLEELTIHFSENGSYNIDSQLIFEPPAYDKKTMYHIYNSANAILQKLEKNIPLNKRETEDIKTLPAIYLLCYFNGFTDAKDKLLASKASFKQLGNSIYASYKESVRILRKVNYN